MDPDTTSDNAQALDDSGTSPEILDSTVSRIWYSVSSFPGLFWNVLCWQLNPLIKLYYVIVTSLDGSRGKQRKLICWLEAMCGREVRNLQAVWEDGSIVCDVINAVMVGSCEPKDHHGNCLRHAQELASHHFKLLPVFSNSELQKPFNSSLEKRLWRYLLSLRNALKHRLANNIADQEEKDPEYLIAEEYVARGMGLILASRAERAIFFIYSRDDSSLADIHVHIKGPHGDCGEATAGEPIDSENHTIAIDYRLTPDYLKVCYIPNNLGYHELSLTRYGFNIPGSPFIIKVGEHTGPPSDMFSYLEWLTDEQEERRRLEMEKKRKMKVVSRVIDFITEKMHMTDDGHLVRIDETSLRVPSPVPHNLKRTGRSLSPRPRCKLSSQKRSKSLTNQKLIQAAEFLKCSSPNFFEEKKCVQDAASQVSDDFSMINSVRIDQFQEKCQRIVKACDFLLSHAPKQKSLEILSTAEKILDIPYNNTLTHHKSSFELYRPDNSVTPDINIQNLATESSRSSETDEEKEVIKPCTPEINVTRVDFSDRLYSMRKFDDDGLNAVSSFNSSSSTNENISTPHLNREKDRSKSTSPQKDAKMARKSFQTVGYTKAKRSSQSSFPTSNISDEICPSDNKNEKIEENQNQIIGDNKEMSDTPTVDTIGENEEKQHDSVGDVENLSNVPTLNTIEGIAEDNRDTTNEKLVDSSDLSQKNTEEEIDFEHSSTRQSRSREPKLTRNSKQAKKVSNLVKQFENQSVRSSASPLRNELVLVKDGETGDKVENSVKTPIEEKELSGTNIGIIEKDFGVEMDDGKILEDKKSLKGEINDLNVFEAEINDGKSLNVEISSEKRVKTEKNDGKILEADMNNEKILEAEVNDGKSLNIEINDEKSLETEINEQVMKSSEDDSEIIKITGETKENASRADICDPQPSEEPDEISDFVCNSRIEVEQDIKCSTNEYQTITVDETDKTVGVTSGGNEEEDSSTQNRIDDCIRDDKKQSE
ncbi:uncharacterized protein LOC111051176 isoform X2 [Nilaparvata lugens]|uniref:uncharacterized protein LOC111051176 isoform X2 n=1 Tax=Nilaparvata lugens TaxID=108931 RepID=UPI00193DA97A|nr:uncharacterized protein LOC111051176 isoform X2 [Nilaparvata lugens]